MEFLLTLFSAFCGPTDMVRSLVGQSSTYLVQSPIQKQFQDTSVRIQAASALTKSGNASATKLAVGAFCTALRHAFLRAPRNAFTPLKCLRRTHAFLTADFAALHYIERVFGNL